MCDWRVRSMRAAGFTEKPTSFAKAWMRLRVFKAIRLLSAKARETVAADTPASFAISCKVRACSTPVSDDEAGVSLVIFADGRLV
ncbi:hypothetical protein TomTYG45_37210 [Sphingobium sp. TomTYG45]